MASFEIIVDSAANIPAALRKEHNISVIPYRYLVDGEERLCFDENVSFEQTAKREHIEEALVPVLEAGKDVFLVIISSGVSGTYQQAVRAAESLKERYPGRKIEVIDSKNASMGEGTIALRVADLRDMGESIEACAEWARTNAYKVNSYLTVGDLKYLKRTGRISTTLAIAGTLLNIKPILRADGSTNAKIVFEGRRLPRSTGSAWTTSLLPLRSPMPTVRRMPTLLRICFAEWERATSSSNITISARDRMSVRVRSPSSSRERTEGVIPKRPRLRRQESPFLPPTVKFLLLPIWSRPFGAALLCILGEECVCSRGTGVYSRQTGENRKRLALTLHPSSCTMKKKHEDAL